MLLRTLLALAIVAATASAVDTPGLEVPLKSPVAKRLRAKATVLYQKAKAQAASLQERLRQPPDSEDYPVPDELRDAFRNAQDAIDLFEKAQRKEWDTATAMAEVDCLRTWIDLRKVMPAEEAPKDPEALAKWTKAKARALKERKRDARRVFSKYEQGRRHAKLFAQCRRCDGRGELRSSFGEKSTCPSCRGNKVHAERRTILGSYWLCFSPFYRADGRNRSRVNQVLRTGVRSESRLAPFVQSYRIKGAAEDHGWWLRATVIEKVHEDPHTKKGTEQTVDYVIMKVGKSWWIHRGRVDTQLLDPRELEAAKDQD